MPDMIVVVGLPGSGKSVLAERLSHEYDAIVLSSDAIRVELYNNINDQGHNNEVFEELHKRIKENLINGKSVVFDACNISYKRRRAFLESIGKIKCHKICYLMATPYEDCLKQNKMRERQVPEYVIKKMYLNFFIPMYQEGWDEIKIEWNYNPKDFDLNELFNGENGLNKIDQNNSHHTLTIGRHCLKCAANVELQDEDNYELFEAGLLHDIGKRFTKQFKNAKGEETNEAHYYGHMNVGAYDALFYIGNDDIFDVLDICAYIQFHMQPFFLTTEKSKRKFINFVGQTFYDNLLILHNADVEAH